ncbi:flagellar biosynthetic protein FliO [Syntrophotalea acetylenivorans]|uniref:Flagellar protein n=1 Tax=Syntrophotalea acetylenivorans TaxID=1842532 RepID=A0A1L3GNS4_9BACT|nr:flagellar biosynthetic protein FliO [Syntrophotalea acetylenivorans]APG27328.1 flagellar biosynthetic protein FliO [Syntrophotalea acetylenivorans]
MLLCSLLLLLPVTAHAAAETPDPMIGSGLRMLVGLLVVLGLMLLLYALSKRGLRWLPGNREGKIRIRETRPLGAKKALCLVEVQGRELLLGVSSEGINLLCELEPQQGQSFEQTLQSQNQEGLK